MSESNIDRDWLVKQLRAWPKRVDPTKTTNVTILMKAAAAALSTPSTLNETPDNFKAGAEVSSFVQSDAAVIERAASEAIVLIDEINKHAPSRRFNGINQPLHCKLATIRATLARALRPVLDAREGG